ncbi:hypothetical protein IQ265_10010 [Nodosilinea sp. LEGE 06152]|uniref:hypothetical protein n=1 Tax=Nodosilinea sp. LEGE 06152 TaxID=2777966 RepID=UPI001880B08D|nr:hypothetical protein [Nodosilinea sp. LEGE 06152]MBE9157156.1 hypothetical protein [Nodosilinea sp. LEGE 06152]
MGQRIQRLSVLSFGGLVLVSAGLAGLLHWASPLRDPSFEVNSANAGTSVPWLKGVPETAWLQASFALAALLAVNLTWVLWQWSQAPQRSGSRGIARWVTIAAIFFLAMGFSSTVVVFTRYSYGPINPIAMAALVALTVLLTAHFVGMVWFWQRTKTALAQLSEPAPSLQRWGRIYTSVYWAGFAACLFTALQILFLGYLFGQHMVD